MTRSVRRKLSCCCPPRESSSSWWTLLGSISGWARIWPESSRARKRRRLDRERTCDRCAPPPPEEEEVCCCCSSFLFGATVLLLFLSARRSRGSCVSEVGLAHSLAQSRTRGVSCEGSPPITAESSLLASLWSCRLAELRPSPSRVESSCVQQTQTVLRSVVALRAAPICARLEYDGALCLRASSAWRTSRRCKTARKR